jgi:hypothetical protein
VVCPDCAQEVVSRYPAAERRGPARSFFNGLLFASGRLRGHPVDQNASRSLQGV